MKKQEAPAMVGDVLGIATLVITTITWMDELTWARDHVLPLHRRVLAALAGKPARGYVHNPYRNYRVAGPERKI